MFCNEPTCPGNHHAPVENEGVKPCDRPASESSKELCVCGKPIHLHCSGRKPTAAEGWKPWGCSCRSNDRSVVNVIRQSDADRRVEALRETRRVHVEAAHEIIRVVKADLDEAKRKLAEAESDKKDLFQAVQDTKKLLAEAEIVNNKYSELIGKHSLEAAKAKGALADAEERVGDDSYMKGRQDCFKENHPRIRAEAETRVKKFKTAGMRLSLDLIAFRKNYEVLAKEYDQSDSRYRTLVEGVRQWDRLYGVRLNREDRALLLDRLDREVKG